MNNIEEFYKCNCPKWNVQYLSKFFVQYGYRILDCCSKAADFYLLSVWLSVYTSVDVIAEPVLQMTKSYTDHARQLSLKESILIPLLYFNWGCQKICLFQKRNFDSSFALDAHFLECQCKMFQVRPVRPLVLVECSN